MSCDGDYSSVCYDRFVLYRGCIHSVTYIVVFKKGRPLCDCCVIGLLLFKKGRPLCDCCVIGIITYCLRKGGPCVIAVLLVWERDNLCPKTYKKTRYSYYVHRKHGTFSTDDTAITQGSPTLKATIENRRYTYTATLVNNGS